MKRFVSMLCVVAMSLLLVSSAFAQAEFSMGGRADYELTYESTEAGDADAVNKLMTSDGGRVQFKGVVSKELDNGATVKLEGVINIEREAVNMDNSRIYYMNGPLTVTMIKADRPGFMGKGVDVYVPQGPLYNCEWTGERGISFKYAGEGMTFTGTLNYQGSNKIAVRPALEMKVGPATLKAAVEYLTEFQQDLDADGPTVSNFGGGAGVELGLGDITIGASSAYGLKGGTDAAGDDIDQTAQMSAYSFVKVNVGPGTIGIGSGYDIEVVDNVDNDYVGYQANLGYEQGNIIVPGLKLAFGAGYAINTDHDDVENTKTGVKVRLRYEF